MSGISNRLDDWPVQNTKRIRKKPQRFVAEEEEGKESKKKKQSKKPAAKLHNTNKIIAVKASNIHKKMKIDQILKQGGMSIDPSTKGSSSLSTKYKTMAKRLNTNTNAFQPELRHDNVKNTTIGNAFYPGDKPGVILSIPTMHIGATTSKNPIDNANKDKINQKGKSDNNNKDKDEDSKNNKLQNNSQPATFTDEEKEELLKYPIVILKKLFPESINSQMKNFDSMIKNYGTQEVDVLLQNPKDVGFNLDDHTNQKQPLKRFLKYFTNLLEKNRKIKKRFKKKRVKAIGVRDIGFEKQHCIVKDDGTVGIDGQSSDHNGMMMDNNAINIGKKGKNAKKKDLVKYCVNVDMREWKEYRKLLETVLPRFLLCQKADDILRHVRQDIEGMTSPQMYLKVPGVWTGGHEENLRFRSINCSHGDGASMWYAVAPEHAIKLREVVYRECGVDIYEDEGRYFPSVKFLRSHGIPVMTGIQEPGDVVVLKGGTQHWVRSMGHAINTSWNFGLGSLEQLQTAFTRYEINKEVKRVDNIVPMKMLLIDYVYETIINEKKDFDSDPALKLFITTKLQEILNGEIEQHQICKKCTIKNVEGIHEELDGAKIIFCEAFCPDREFVNIYVHCSTCQEVNNKRGTTKKRKLTTRQKVYFCVECAMEHQEAHPNHVMSVSERQAGSFQRLVKLMQHPKLDCLDDNVLKQINNDCLKHIKYVDEEEEEEIDKGSKSVKKKVEKGNEVEEEKVGNDTLNDKSNTPVTAMKQIEIKEMEPIMGDVENKMDIVDNDEEFDPNNAKVVRSVVKRLL